MVGSAYVQGLSSGGEPAQREACERALAAREAHQDTVLGLADKIPKSGAHRATKAVVDRGYESGGCCLGPFLLSFSLPWACLICTRTRPRFPFMIL